MFHIFNPLISAGLYCCITCGLPALDTHTSTSLCLQFLYLSFTIPTKKGKFKKVKGATVSVSPTKRGNKAGNHRRLSATPVQDLNLMMDKEDAAPPQDELAQNLEVMMRMLTDLTSRVRAMENQQREVVASPSVSQTTFRPVRRRARHQL